MGRTVGTSLASNLDGGFGEPRWLLRLGSSRFANGGSTSGGSISYDSQTWVKADFEVAPFADDGYVESFQVTFNLADADKSTFTAFQSSDACELYATCALSSYAGANDVVKLYDGIIGGGWTLEGNTFRIECGDFEVWPVKYVGPELGLTEVAAPGVYDIQGGDYTVVLEKGY